MKTVDEAVAESQMLIREITEAMLLQNGLQLLRDEQRLSQKRVAETMGISQPAVAQIEQRGNEIKIGTLKRYIEALGGKLSLTVEMSDGSGRIFHI